MDGTLNLSLSGTTLGTSPSQNHQARAAMAQREVEDMGMAAREARDLVIQTLGLNPNLNGQSLSLTDLCLRLIGIPLTMSPSQKHQTKVVWDCGDKGSKGSGYSDPEPEPKPKSETDWHGDSRVSMLLLLLMNTPKS